MKKTITTSLLFIALFIFIEIKRRKQILKNINNNTVIE